MAWTDPITESQKEYIQILTHNPEDKKIIEETLSKHNKSSLDKLNRKEAHDLIQKLLEIEVEYTFPCGLKDKITKEEYNKFEIFGELEACIHSCPKNIDIYECKYWTNNE